MFAQTVITAPQTLLFLDIKNTHAVRRFQVQNPIFLVIFSLGAGLVSIQFNFTETKSSSCNLTVYNTDTGAPLVFNCSLTDCVLKKQKTDYMLIKCADSNCKCTSWCSGITLGAVSRINGPATFECTTSPNTNEIDCSVNG